MTSDDETRPPSRRPPRGDPRLRRPADQGDLWPAAEEAAPAGETAANEPSPDEGIAAAAADFPPGQTTPPPARLPAGPPAYPQYDNYGDGDEYSMLRNPYILAALAVAGAIVLAVAFVIAFSRGDDGPVNFGVAAPTRTPLPGELPGVQARVIAIAAIREGPGLEFFELGLLRTGQEVSVVGRNEDSSWYQVTFAGAELRGWVPDSALRLPDGADDAIEVVVFTPIPKPSVEQPTATPAATATEESLGPPDIAVELLGNVCPESGPMNLVLRNVGDFDISSREIAITISTQSGVVSEQTLIVRNLDVGAIVPVDTGVEARPPRTTVAVVFLEAPQDQDPSNNVVTCVVAGGGGLSSTAVPPPAETPDDP